MPQLKITLDVFTVCMDKGFNEMGGACGAYGGGERCAQVSGGET